MNPKSQKSNFITALVVSLIILMGWFWLQNKIWPPRPRDDKKDDVAKKDKDVPKAVWDKVGPFSRGANVAANQMLALGGLPGAARLAVDVKQAEPPPARLATFAEVPGPLRPVLAMLPPPLASPWALVTQMVVRSPALTPPPAQAKLETLGGKEHFIQATLTSRGAGVQKLVLPKFKAANYLGQPAKGDLELIGEDPVTASYLLFHYPKDEKLDMRPLASLGDRVWEMGPKTESPEGVQQIRFHTTVTDPDFQHLKITKTYRLEPRAYHLKLILEIEDTRPKTEGKADYTKFRYQLTGPHGMPVEGGWYTNTYRQSLIGSVDENNNLWRNFQDSMSISHRAGGDKVDRKNYWLQYACVATQFFAAGPVVDDEQPTRAEGGVEAKNVLAWVRPTLESQERPGRVQNIDWDNGFMEVIHGQELETYRLLPRVKSHLQELGIVQLDADGKLSKIQVNAPLVVSWYASDAGKVCTWVRQGQTPRGYFDDITVRVNSEPVELLPQEKRIHQFLLYHGPVKTALLSQFSGDQAVTSGLVKRYTDTLHLRTLTDYRSEGPFGYISQKIMFTDLLILITSWMHTLLYWLHFLVGGYGLAIILLTVIVRGLMFPISRKQALFAQRMQELAPELKKIQARYKGDARARTEATMEFYRKHKVNPLASCLPLLLQMPIFLGLYFALQESIHFRLAGFLWIDNLAAPDMFLYWTQSIPWISDPDNLGGLGYLGPFLNVLPLAAVFLMIVQQRMMTPPAQDEQQAAQQRMMKWMMILFGFFFYKVAAGLCIYFIASSLWGVAERKLLPKKTAAAQAGAAPPPPPPTDGKGPKLIPGGPKGKGGPKPAPKEESNGPLARIKRWWAEVLKKAQKK